MKKTNKQNKIYLSLGLWFLLAFQVLNTEEKGLQLHNLSQHHVQRGGLWFWSREPPIYFFYNALTHPLAQQAGKLCALRFGVFSKPAIKELVFPQMCLVLIKHFQVVLESLAVKPPWELQRQIWSSSLFIQNRLLWWLSRTSRINCSGPIAHASVKINYFISITPLVAV